MRVDELPPREWRRRHLRILAAARHRRTAAELKAVRRTPIHPAHERWLKYRAVGRHRCRPWVMPVGAASLSDAVPAVWTRGPAADVVIVDDPSRVGELPPQMRDAVGSWWADVERRERQR